jgi:hypothetical protein
MQLFAHLQQRYHPLFLEVRSRAWSANSPEPAKSGGCFGTQQHEASAAIPDAAKALHCGWLHM